MKESRIKAIWPHNFPPKIKNSASFVHSLAKALKDLGVDIKLEYIGNLRNIKNFVLAKKYLSCKIKNFDIIHSQFGSACGYLVSKLPGVKILSLRGSDWYGTSSGSLWDLFHGKLQRELTKRSLNRYSGIIVMSQRMIGEVSPYYNKNLIKIPDGLDLNVFYQIDRHKARKFLGKKEDNTPYVLFASNLKKNPVKRSELAIQAYVEAKKMIPNLKLDFVYNECHKKMNIIINSSNVLLLTSTHEGWPNIIKEGLACNIPFITTDVSDLKQISEKERSCFVTDADPKLLGRAIVNAISQDRPYDLRKYAKCFEIETIAKNILKFYETCLNKE